MRLIAVVIAVACTSCGRKNFDPDASPDAPTDGTAIAHNIAFVTSTTHSASTYGADFAGADAICNARAAAAGLPGTYVALLSSSTVDARDRLGTARGWVRTDGLPFVDRVADLVNGTILTPLILDENGGSVGNALAHTGTEDDGTKSFNTCVNYTSSVVNDTITIGSTDGTRSEFFETGDELCTETARLYCMGIDRTNALEYTPATGRHMFVTVQPFVPDGTGIAQADALCNSEAALAGLTGSFLALLATSGTSALSRFDLGGATWVRLDGVPLAATPLDVASNKLLTTPNVTSARTYVGGQVSTGASSPVMPGDSGADTCADWTANGSARLGRPNLSFEFFHSNDMGTCNRPIYCFEQ